MQKFYTFVFVIVLGCRLNAQEIQEITTGAGYQNQSFVNLSTGTEKLVKNDTWDIGFTAFGHQDAGIFINEASGSSMGQALPQIELYDAMTQSFSEIPNYDLYSEARLYNAEKSWSYGAFNEVRDTTDIFDYGWGSYDFAKNKVVGNRIYVIKLRNESLKKLMVESLDATTYTFKYANLDGSDLVTKTISKVSDNFGKKLIFFSFASGNSVDILPNDGFDLLYCRYTAIAKDFSGVDFQQYNVTGILTGLGVSVAKAVGIDPNTVRVSDYLDKFSTRLDVIGFDWKTFTGTAYVLAEDEVYFVKLANGEIYKIQLIDFEGATTGTSVLQKVLVSVPTSSSDISTIQAVVSPNPTTDQLNIIIDTDSKTSSTVAIQVTDVNGKAWIHQQVTHISGFNVLNINTSSLPNGTYFVQIMTGNNQVSTKKFVKI